MADTQFPSHPYYPPTLFLPNYNPSNRLNQLDALLSIFLPLLFLALLTNLLTGTIRFPNTPLSPHLTHRERFLAIWFITCASLHIILEGTFVLHAPYFTLHSSPSLIPAIWREYALSDSRYLLPTDHPSFTFLYAIELITVVITGPLCLVCVWGLVWRKSWRVVPQVVVATAHLWGVAMYFLTGVLEGERWTRVDGVYRWGYFWGMNAPWVGVSLWVLWGAGKESMGLERLAEGRNREAGSVVVKVEAVEESEEVRIKRE